MARDLPFKVLGLEHVAIALSDSDDLRTFFTDKLGLELGKQEEVIDQGVLTEIFNLGGSKVEFLNPLDGSSTIRRFLDRRGNALHHIALSVDDISKAISFLVEEGVEMIDTKPRVGAEGYSIAFIHPRSTSGVLIELCQKQDL